MRESNLGWASGEGPLWYVSHWLRPAFLLPVDLAFGFGLPFPLHLPYSYYGPSANMNEESSNISKFDLKKWCDTTCHVSVPYPACDLSSYLIEPYQNQIKPSRPLQIKRLKIIEFNSSRRGLISLDSIRNATCSLTDLHMKLIKLPIKWNGNPKESFSFPSSFLIPC
jgi:hypothetical protein